MLLVEAGKVALDEPVQRYLPGFTGSGKEAVTVRHLLEHRSGLRAFLPLNDLAENAADARRLVLEEPLRWPPGRQVVYSDLNAMLLGWIVERVSGMQFDRFIEKELFEPLGLTETRFRPPPKMRHRIAPVGLWRGHVIAGRVHDQNAEILGGVAGHAGLYSTGRDLARYAQMWLRRGLGEDSRRVLRAETIGEFTMRGTANRALGWEMRDTTSRDNTGVLLSQSAYGHGGYTGTSIWIDPERDLFVIVLTNRVFAPRVRNSIRALKKIRARVADAAVALRLELCSLRTASGGERSRC
jgi:CubicO group peptidase (beta-lactamase class C family)